MDESRMTQPDRERFSVHWEKDCNDWHGRLLTGKFCHWCDDWDDLPIDETCDEFAACSCEWEDDNMTREAESAREAKRTEGHTGECDEIPF